MPVKGTEVVVRRRHGKLVVQLLNRTNRGVKYIKQEIPMESKNIADAGFKAELASKVAELPQSAPLGP